MSKMLVSPDFSGFSIGNRFFKRAKALFKCQCIYTCAALEGPRRFGLGVWGWQLRLDETKNLVSEFIMFRQDQTIVRWSFVMLGQAFWEKIMYFEVVVIETSGCTISRIHTSSGWQK